MVDIGKEAVKQINHYRKQWPIVVLMLFVISSGMWYLEREIGKITASHYMEMDHLVDMISDKDDQFTRCQEDMLTTLLEMEIHLATIASK